MIIYIYNFRFFHHFHHARYIRSEKPLEQAIFERDKKCDKSDMCDEFYITQYRCRTKKESKAYLLCSLWGLFGVCIVPYRFIYCSVNKTVQAFAPAFCVRFDLVQYFNFTFAHRLYATA